MNRFSLILLAGAAVLSVAPAAQAADLIVQQPSMPGFVDAGGGGWDGAYVGGFVGYGWGTVTDDNLDIPAPGLEDDELGLTGWTVGGTVGANFTVAPGFVIGAAGDIAWADIGGYDDLTDFGYDINWTGSLRGRAGFDGGAFMPYLTAGLAFAGATAEIGPDESTQMHFGWTAGGGVEVAATDSLSVDVQYRYSDYGSATYDLGTDTDLSISTHAVTAGVNFKF